MSTPRRYAKSHEWIRVEGTTGTVGISDHAQKEVTDVVYVEMAKTGKTVKAGDEATTLESVKAAFSVYAPASGTITKTNHALEAMASGTLSQFSPTNAPRKFSRSGGL